jgi:hypothetical protein
MLFRQKGFKSNFLFTDDVDVPIQLEAIPPSTEQQNSIIDQSLSFASDKRMTRSIQYALAIAIVGLFGVESYSTCVDQ